MNAKDSALVAGFLITEQARFSEYLENYDIDSAEGLVIIEGLLEKVDGQPPAHIQKTPRPSGKDTLFNETIKVVVFIKARRSKRTWRRSILVDAVVLPPFAIHPSMERFGRFARPDRLFTVSHVPSGLSLFHHRTLEACVGFLNDIRELDWSFMDRPDFFDTCKTTPPWKITDKMFPDLNGYLVIRKFWEGK